MVEQVKQKASLRELRNLRIQFGRDSAGKLAFKTIVRGASCEAILDGRGTLCGQRAEGTVDFDVLEGCDFVPSCVVHEELIGTRILTDLERQGRTTVLGKNGRGRA